MDYQKRRVRDEVSAENGFTAQAEGVQARCLTSLAA